MSKHWVLTKDTPLVKFLDKLSTVSTQLVQLHALRQTHLALRQIQAMKKKAQENENAIGLEQSKPRSAP